MTVKKKEKEGWEEFTLLTPTPTNFYQKHKRQREHPTPNPSSKDNQLLLGGKESFSCSTSQEASLEISLHSLLSYPHTSLDF